MNETRFDDDLEEALGNQSDFITPRGRKLALRRTVIEYSRWKPLLRRYGTGLLFLNARIDDTVIEVVGGGFVAGDVLTIDTEEVTVQSVDLAEETQAQTVGITELTLTTPVTVAHKAGSDIALASGQFGLKMVPGQALYNLPPDWISVDQESLDIALGVKGAVKKSDTYYDSVYKFSNMLSGQGYGYTSNSAVGYPTGYPIAGNPFDNPNSGGFVGQGETLFRFIEGAQPKLWVAPAPAAERILDVWYHGAHAIQTVPERDSDACLCYAAWAALSGQSAALSAGLDYSDDDVSESPSRNAAQLQTLAAMFFDQWEDRIRNKPYAAVG